MQNNRRSNNGFGKSRPQSNFRSRSGHNTYSPKYNRGRRGESKLDINSYIQKAIQKAAEPQVKTVIQHTFLDFDLSLGIQDNLKYKGYRIPTPIQDQSIKPILEGKDLIGMANTGTGKTAAFLLPMIEKVYKDRTEKVLIVAPTRELALQIETELREFSYRMRIFYVSCVGGMPIGRQIRDIKNHNPNFIIGTPGRIKDLTDRGLIRLHTFKNVILDEVDRMLDMGFVDEIKFMLNELPKERQSLFFSATMPPKIKNLIETFSNNPVIVQVKSQEISNNVKQEVIRTSKDMKFGKLTDLLGEPGADKVLVFSETKRDVEKLSNDLISHGFKADSIHGDKRQGQRQRALNNFKENRIGILVATDVAARGLDIKEVTHVINYTVPQTYEDYVHRIGRTGRADSIGKALTFVV